MMEHAEVQEPADLMRLQKYLARAGVASRRGSETLMTTGRVTVNGLVVTELGSKVNPRTDQVRVDGVLCSIAERAVTIMLNKPSGYITTMSDPQGRPTVADLVPVDQFPGLFPIGRLDLDTTGLLLFSTDGELGNGLLHPRHHVDKTYIARVDGFLNAQEVKRLREGVLLDDGMTLPAQVEILERSHCATKLRITIHEGRKRQVRRMMSFVGHPVVELERIQFGPLTLHGLKEGCWRLLTPSEEAQITNAAKAHLAAAEKEDRM